jgi:hypothetical protein
MATIVTRTLGKADRYDRKTIRVDGLAYKDKWGIIEILLTNYVTTVSGGSVDVRVPNFNAANDNVNVSDKGNTAGTTAVTSKIYIAVNNGIPGPSVRVNPDGTWDLLDLVYTLPENNALTGCICTLTYTLSAFLDLTASLTNPTTTGTAYLDISPGKHSDSGIIGILNSSLGSSNGYIKAWLNAITSTMIDKTVPYVGDSDPVGLDKDPAPNFAVVSGSADCAGCAVDGALTMIRHPLAKVAGVKTYSQGLLVFAVNTGKIDGNGMQLKGTNGQAAALKCILEQAPGGDDTANLAVEHTITFTAI